MSTQTTHEDATPIRTAAGTDLKLEVVVIPVSDVDRAKRFYESLGWRPDADFAHGDDWRLVQMTPPGSPCSVMFGKGFTTAAPGSVQGTFLVVDDLEAARSGLIGHGVNVSEVFHFDAMLLRAAGTKGRVSGPDPEGRSYLSFASFSDPDGNSWLLQEVTSRLPGRGLSLDLATLTELLKETEKRHGEYEPTAPKHHWSDWYAAYIVARENGLYSRRGCPTRRPAHRRYPRPHAGVRSSAAPESPNGSWPRARAVRPPGAREDIEPAVPMTVSSRQRGSRRARHEAVSCANGRHVKGSRGMVISRRPKSRASIDSAPGPSNASAAASTTTISAARRSMRTDVSGGVHVAMHMMVRPATAPDTGVRNPATSASPLTTASAAEIPISAFGSLMCVRCTAP